MLSRVSSRIVQRATRGAARPLAPRRGYAGASAAAASRRKRGDGRVCLGASLRGARARACCRAELALGRCDVSVMHLGRDARVACAAAAAQAAVTGSREEVVLGCTPLASLRGVGAARGTRRSFSHAVSPARCPRCVCPARTRTLLTQAPTHPVPCAPRCCLCLDPLFSARLRPRLVLQRRLRVRPRWRGRGRRPRTR